MDRKRQVFKSVKALPSFPEEEERVLVFWEDNDVFERLRELRKGSPLFCWLEGFLTASGLPHIGHALVGAIRDVFFRHRFVHGFEVVPWVAGWDCHGLPVELEVEKTLGFTDRSEVEEFGLSNFNVECRRSVFKYVREWQDMSRCVGFWLDFESRYVVLDESCVESVWWLVKEICREGLLYLGYKVVPCCPRCGTFLSLCEVGQGMMETTDPSVYVRFRALDFEDIYCLAWITIPWTLILNVCLTVSSDIDCVQVEYSGEKLILVETIAEELLVEYTVLQKFRGRDFEYSKYE